MNNCIIEMYSKILRRVIVVKLWLNTPKWLNRYTYYSIFFCLFIILHSSIVWHFSLFNNNPDSARYMLSALVQSEAAIIAIVITLSLVAVQLTAQSYSMRVIEIFNKTPDIWILIGIYVIAMTYGTSVLKLIKIANMNELQPHISLAYIIGIFCFIILIPYTSRILKLMSPFTIIDILLEEFNANKKTFVSVKPHENNHFDDLLLPIMDVLRNSLINYNTEDTIYGLRKIRDQINEMLENNTIVGQNETIVDKNETIIIEHFLLYVQELGEIAVSKRYKNVADEIISILLNNGRIAAKMKISHFTWFNIEILGEIGKLSAEIMLLSTTKKAITSIRYIGFLAVKQKLPNPAYRAVISLREIGEFAVQNKLNEEIEEIIKSLEVINNIAAMDADFNHVVHEIQKSVHLIKSDTLIEE